MDLITEKILEIISGFECIKNRSPEVDFLENDGISIQPVSDDVLKQYVSGDSLRQFVFRLVLNTDYLKENVREVYGFFESFKAELERQKAVDIDDKLYALVFAQEGSFEAEHLSGAQMKYAVKCILNYYKRGE
ncbi:MAG: hypothetical protein IKL42_04460 [Clostridia bacterium]|nr:hypothetical protein [Clostridia bacterium]MBR3576639.1 hypothetical protein [Clostridia bacterium]